MKIPKGMTEDEVLQIILKVAKRLANKFRFGYHDYNDMVQQGVVEGIKGMKKYDGVRPLENFQSVHIRNRLFNFKRDNYTRPTPPCKKCGKMKSLEECQQYEDQLECESYSSWFLKNVVRRNLMQPIELGNVDDNHESNMKITEEADDIIVRQEMHDIIDRELPVHLRALYVRMRDGLPVPKPQRVLIQETITEILETHYGMPIKEIMG